MSVIPFVIAQKDPTVVSTKEHYQNAGGIEGSAILIKNLDEDQIRNPVASNASYDLRVGSEYRDHRDSSKTELRDNDYIVLQPGSAVIIETIEEVEFPRARFGHIVPKVSLLQRGISNTSSKIDPGYAGRLLITVFNLGQRKVRLKKGDKFCTLYVIDIAAGVEPYQKSSKRIIGEPKVRWRERLGEQIEIHKVKINVLFSIIAIVIAVISLISN